MALRNMRIWRYIDEVARVGSVRQAAERLHVTPSAVLRRIQDVEQDLGAELFERTASGAQLTAVGEIFVQWIRSQDADLRRVYSLIQELSGLRRGEIRIACSQAVAESFLIDEIVAFRRRHPLVSFKVSVTDHGAALDALIRYATDMILVFGPPRAAELQPITTIGQRLVAVVASGHPLARKPVVRLRDCAAYDVALPDRGFGARQIVEDVLAAGSARFNVVFEANSFDMLYQFVKHTDAASFQVEIGALRWRRDPAVAILPISDADLAHGPLVLGQLKGRALPIAAAKFAEQLSRRMDELRTLPVMAPAEPA